MMPNRLNTISLGLYLSGEYEAAVEMSKRAIRSNPGYPLNYRWLAASLGQLGRTGEAHEALQKATAIGPACFDMYVRRRVPWHRRKTTRTCSMACAKPDGKVECLRRPGGG